MFIQNWWAHPPNIWYTALDCLSGVLRHFALSMGFSALFSAQNARPLHQHRTAWSTTSGLKSSSTLWNMVISGCESLNRGNLSWLRLMRWFLMLQVAKKVAHSSHCIPHQNMFRSKLPTWKMSGSKKQDEISWCRILSGPKCECYKRDIGYIVFRLPLHAVPAGGWAMQNFSNFSNFRAKGDGPVEPSLDAD
jgi:hypothetical protein